MPYKEKDGTFRGIVTIGKKKISQKRGFTTSRAAVEWEIEEKKKLKKESSMSSLDLYTLSGEYLKYAQKYSRNTLVEKTTLCKRINKLWGSNKPVEDITPKTALDYLQAQSKDRSANSANRDRKNLVAMWNYGKTYLGLRDNPFLIIPKFAHDRKPQYVPPRADVMRLKAACNDVEYAYLCTMLQTGGRRSEIHRLGVEDVNLVTRKITLRNRKSRDGSLQARTLDMTDELTAVLSRWLKIRPIKDSAWLFYVTDERSPHYGEPFTKRRRFLKGLCKRAEVREMGYHALRRHVASFLAAKGAPSSFIQSVLGHASISTTDRYISNIADDQRDLMNLLDSSGESSGESDANKMAKNRG
jgi:integrase